MKIKELLATMEERGLPCAEEHETIQGVLMKMLQYPHTRLVYVTGENGQCTGVISLGTLIRHLFPQSFEAAVHVHSIISMITSETAKDIMNKGLIFAGGEDDLETVIKRMVQARIKEIPILDDQKRIIADLTMLDLLQYYHPAPE